jgi:hypothetical protein
VFVIVSQRKVSNNPHISTNITKGILQLESRDGFFRYHLKVVEFVKSAEITMKVFLKYNRKTAIFTFCCLLNFHFFALIPAGGIGANVLDRFEKIQFYFSLELNYIICLLLKFETFIKQEF